MSNQIPHFKIPIQLNPKFNNRSMCQMLKLQTLPSRLFRPQKYAQARQLTTQPTPASLQIFPRNPKYKSTFEN